MLVLSRKKNEAIIIGEEIRIVVAEVRGDKVRLGIEAPKEVSVHREEVKTAIELCSKEFLQTLCLACIPGGEDCDCCTELLGVKYGPNQLEGYICEERLGHIEQMYPDQVETYQLSKPHLKDQLSKMRKEGAA